MKVCFRNEIFFIDFSTYGAHTEVCLYVIEKEEKRFKRCKALSPFSCEVTWFVCHIHKFFLPLPNEKVMRTLTHQASSTSLISMKGLTVKTLFMNPFSLIAGG